MKLAQNIREVDIHRKTGKCTMLKCSDSSQNNQRLLCLFWDNTTCVLSCILCGPPLQFNISQKIQCFKISSLPETTEINHSFLDRFRSFPSLMIFHFGDDSDVQMLRLKKHQCLLLSSSFLPSRATLAV